MATADRVASLTNGIAWLVRVLGQAPLPLARAAQQIGADWQTVGLPGPGAHLAGLSGHPAFGRVELSGRGRSDEVRVVDVDLAAPTEVSLQALEDAWGPADETPVLDDSERAELSFGPLASASLPCRCSVLISVPRPVDRRDPVCVERLTVVRDCLSEVS